MSENGATAELNAALAKAQAEFPTITRDKSVEVTGTSKDGKPFKYAYKYAPLDVILDATRKPLTDNGLALVQLLDGPGLRTELRHASGGVVGAVAPFPSLPAKMQDYGSMLSFLRRYAVLAILGLATEEDDDGQTAQRGAEKKAPPAGESAPNPSSSRILAKQQQEIEGFVSDLVKLNQSPPAPHLGWLAYWDAECLQNYGETVENLSQAQAQVLIDSVKPWIKSLIEEPSEQPSFAIPDGAA